MLTFETKITDYEINFTPELYYAEIIPMKSTLTALDFHLPGKYFIDRQVRSSLSDTAQILSWPEPSTQRYDIDSNYFKTMWHMFYSPHNQYDSFDDFANQSKPTVDRVVNTLQLASRGDLISESDLVIARQMVSSAMEFLLIGFNFQKNTEP